MDCAGLFENMNVSRWLICLCLLGALGLSSCVAGDLSIELVPSVGQTLTNVDLLTFKETGPGLQEEPGTFDVNFSSGTATLPQLILDKNATDKRISVRAFAYRNSERIVAIGATDYTIRPEAGQVLRVLISQTEKFGWLTDLDSSKKSELPYELVGHQAVPLNDGRVLLVGGTIYFREDKGIFTLRSVDDLLRQILIYDPQTGRINVDSNAQLSTPRVFHTATVLDDGRVLIAGGIGYFNKTPAPIGTVEIYDPKTGTIESQNTPLQKPRAFHTATKMPDGSVVFVGGLGNVLNPNDSKSWTGQLVLTIEQYNTESNQSIKVTDLKSENGRFLHRATAFSNNTILITGGMQFVGDNNSAIRELTQKSLLIQKGSQGWRITTTLEGNTSSTPRYDH
ncbi:MAG TPA: hypothetical protein DCE42_30390, partial [Myxococcales bacterium]|nr:hypothetical protein [Myxococcales bacterium]